MRQDGMSYRAIGDALGVDHVTVMNAVGENSPPQPETVTGKDLYTHTTERGAGDMERMTQPDMNSMVTAVADGILWGARYGNAHGEQVVYLLPDGTFEAWHDTIRIVPDGALEIVRIGNLDDLLGPDWSCDLPVDDDGRPEVTRELATEWATWWVGEFGQSTIDESDCRTA